MPSLGRRELVDQGVDFQEIDGAVVVGRLEYDVGAVIVRTERITVEDVDANGVQSLGQHRRQPGFVGNLDENNKPRVTLEPRRREGPSGARGVFGHEVHDRARAIPMRGCDQHIRAAGRCDGHQPAQERRLIAGTNGDLNLSSSSCHRCLLPDYCPFVRSLFELDPVYDGVGPGGQLGGWRIIG